MGQKISYNFRVINLAARAGGAGKAPRRLRRGAQLSGIFPENVDKI